MSHNGWIGVDLDRTLAHYDTWVNETHIGEPILPMVERIQEWLAQGIEVKIVTARVSRHEVGVVRAIEDWCIKHIGQALPITNAKDWNMIELWDDRAVQVIPNTGERADALDRIGLARMIIASEIGDAIAAHDSGETVNPIVRANFVVDAIFNNEPQG